MNLSALLIHSPPAKIPDLISLIQSFPWAKSHHHDEQGRLIVTIEAENLKEDQNHLEEIQQLPGVISAEVVEFWPDLQT